MKLTDFLTKLAEVTGQSSDEGIQELLKDESISTIELSESASKLTSSLYSKEQAKNDPDIRDHFYNINRDGIYKNVDDITKSFYKTFELSDDEIAQVEAGDSATKRLKSLMSVAKDKKPVVKDDEAKVKEIERLNDLIISTKEDHKKLVEAIQKTTLQEKTRFLVGNEINKFELVDNIPGGKDFLVRGVFDELGRDYSLNYDESGNLSLKQKDDPSMDVFVDSKKVTFQDVLNEKLTNFIKKSDGKGSPKPPEAKPTPKPSHERTLHEGFHQ